MGFDVFGHPLYKRMMFALKNYPERLTVLDLGQDGIVMESARSNDKRPAYIKMATLDSVVRNLTGNQKLSDLYLLVRIPREVVDRADSPIVAPGEAGG